VICELSIKMGKARRNNDTLKHGRKLKQNEADDDILFEQMQQRNNSLGNLKYILSTDNSYAIYLISGCLFAILFMIDFSYVRSFFLSKLQSLFFQIGYFFKQDFLYYSLGLFGRTNNFKSRNVDKYSVNAPYNYVKVDGRSVRDDPSHPLTFAILRESIIREKGGFVHPDLGLLSPAPSGATRGLGMVRDTYNACQVKCIPGRTKEKIAQRQNGDDELLPPHWNAQHDQLNTVKKVSQVVDEQQSIEQIYMQEEVLLKIPLKIQMTRSVALLTLFPLVPNDVLMRVPLHELDDAVLLVLLLAHERGLGVESRFQPYIKSLPLVPSCGYSPKLRFEALETLTTMGVDMGMDVGGWPGELSKAGDRAHMIAMGLARDYGAYIAVPKRMSSYDTIQWALCQVASRATAASEKHGVLRLVPMLDIVNHDLNAGGFEELSGNERLENDDYVEADEDESGTFIVRSVRHGRRKPLRKGQELLVNYNVPDYSPLDWFVSLGFVPPERTGNWIKLEEGLPKTRTFSSSRL